MSTPIITPAGPLAMHGKASQHFSADQPVTWTKTAGTFSGTTATAVDWKAPNVGGTYTVRATNGASLFSEVTIVVTGLVPYYPDYNFEATDGKRVLFFEPEAGDVQMRSKGRRDIFPFIRNSAMKTEHDEMKQFWDDHYPGKKVYFTIPGETEQLWYIWSDFKRRGIRSNLWGYSFDLRRVT